MTARQIFSAQLHAASHRASELNASAAGPRVFRFPVLLLATWWDAEAGQTSPQFQPGSDTPEYFKAILDGFGGNPRGSLTEFYFENSYGQFLVEVDVFGPYVSNRSRLDRCYYGGIDPPPDYLDDLDPTDSVLGVGGLGAVGMAVEAVPQADPTVNFARYDNDGDGYVDFLGLVHSGADMAVTGDPCNTWSHALPVSRFDDLVEALLGLPPDFLRGGIPTTDAVLIDRLFTMPEFNERGTPLTIGVAAHEMAHALGEPDYDSRNDTSLGTADWDVMSVGVYNGNPFGSNPAWFNPASRVFQGWVTPTIVHGDLRDYRLEPRETPLPGYTAGQPNPNLLLVPTRWIKVGESDADGYTWTTRDVYGLVQDGERGYVIEGWYLEYASRMAGPHAPLDPRMSRSPYFDRSLHGSGLLAWHFDYWRRSNVYFGANDAQNDPNRMQLDVEEFDFYDDTQDIALYLNSGEGSDAVQSTATGITSGTHQAPRGTPPDVGDAQASIAISGLTTPVQPGEAEFTVDDNPANHTMRVRIAGNGPPPGDCKLQLFRREGEELVEESDEVDSGFVGDEELVVVTDPTPGVWVARVADFAGCTRWQGSVEFSPRGFDTRGSADTWSNETEAPTGWAFTNIRAGLASGLDLGAETIGPNELLLDVLQLQGDLDVSPGYARPAGNAAGGRGVVTAGRNSALSVPVFSNGGVGPGSVDVTVRRDATVVAQGTVALGPYQRVEFPFTFDPGAEGPYELTVTVDPMNTLAEGSESNNVQTATGWAGPANPTVLVVDDEGYTDGEDAYIGALAALGVPYAVATGHVDAPTISQYDAVIWVSSALDRGPGQLDEADRGAIAAYLGGGGRLWLASNRAAGSLEYVGATAFLAGWFGADWIETLELGQPHAAKGTGDVLGGDVFALEAYPILPLSTVVDVAPTGVFGQAAKVLTLEQSHKPGRDGAPFGTRVLGDAAHGSFRTVLTPFSLSQATSPDTAIRLTRSVLAFFGVATGQYSVTGTAPLVFHPAVRSQVSGRDTPVTAIVLGGEANQPVTLFYREHGTASYLELPLKAGAEPGSYSGVISGGAVTPSGLDYYIRAGVRSDTSQYVFDPAPAGLNTLSHAIAVAIPEVGG